MRATARQQAPRLGPPKIAFASHSHTPARPGQAPVFCRCRTAPGPRPSAARMTPSRLLPSCESARTQGLLLPCPAAQGTTGATWQRPARLGRTAHTIRGRARAAAGPAWRDRAAKPQSSRLRHAPCSASRHTTYVLRLALCAAGPLASVPPQQPHPQYPKSPTHSRTLGSAREPTTLDAARQATRDAHNSAAALPNSLHALRADQHPGTPGPAGAALRQLD